MAAAHDAVQVFEACAGDAEAFMSSLPLCPVGAAMNHSLVRAMLPQGAGPAVTEISEGQCPS